MDWRITDKEKIKLICRIFSAQWLKIKGIRYAPPRVETDASDSAPVQQTVDNRPDIGRVPGRISEVSPKAHPTVTQGTQATFC
jgi:hypothetical protein